MAGNAQVADRMRKAAALMRSRGLRVEAFSGWASAGRSSDMRPRAVTVHHTAAAVDVDRVLRDGRPGIPGPLCNWAVHKDGSWWLVASGRANHAGVGWLPSSESYGIEATGPVPVTAQGVKAFPNYDEYVLGVACILQAEGWPASKVYAHKETATPDCRKPDPAFGDPCPKPYTDMNAFRGRVQAQLGRPGPPPEEEDVPYRDWPEADRKALTEDVARIIGEGKTIGGDKPAHLVERSQDNLKHLLDLVRVGDTSGGTTDSHDFSSVEGVGRQVKDLAATVADQGRLLQDILAAVSPPT